MKAEEWLTYFVKIYGRRPKMTEVDEAIQNGSLLANRAEVERLLLASKKSIWQTLSQSIVTHKVAASVLFYHLSSISRYLMKNSLSSIVTLRKLSFFELKFSVKSVH